jgi:hypothetical protein
LTQYIFNVSNEFASILLESKNNEDIINHIDRLTKDYQGHPIFEAALKILSNEIKPIARSKSL